MACEVAGSFLGQLEAPVLQRIEKKCYRNLNSGDHRIPSRQTSVSRLREARSTRCSCLVSLNQIRLIEAKARGECLCDTAIVALAAMPGSPHGRPTFAWAAGGKVRTNFTSGERESA